MTVSLAWIILLGLFSDYLFRKLRLPGLIGMLFAGILLGPYVFNLIDPVLMKVSSDLRMIALIVILLRAGLATKRDTLVLAISLLVLSKNQFLVLKLKKVMWCML